MSDVNNTDEEKSAPLSIDVCSIANEGWIEDIFIHRFWSVSEGINYLMGIFEIYRDEHKLLRLETLDGKIYTGEEDQVLIEELLMRKRRLLDVWEHEHAHKNRRYFAWRFIRWGLKHKHICRLSWLDNAKDRGLVTNEWFASDAPVAIPNQTNDDINPKTKTSLLQIIAGLFYYANIKKEHGFIEKIKKEFEHINLPINIKSLSNHLNAALEEYPWDEENGVVKR